VETLSIVLQSALFTLQNSGDGEMQHKKRKERGRGRAIETRGLF